jgi:hypothetical protein
MKHAVFLLVGFAAIAGCSDGEEGASAIPQSTAAVSTDLQDDLWHAHRHVHDNVQVHDHEHTDGFIGGHEHRHGHTHRHTETTLGGIVVSLQRNATAGQLPGGSITVPPRPHLEILPGLPAQLNVCLLSELLPSASTGTIPANPNETDSDETDPATKPAGLQSRFAAAPPNGSSSWSNWNPDLPQITIQFQIQGTEYTLACESRTTSSTAPETPMTVFGAALPDALRESLNSTKARLRVAKLRVEVGQARFRVTEQIYFQGDELSVSLQ